ncbi:MAG: surface protein [Parcubacteria group bacterium Gr01-1014_91]|nr:MAG: surface protein [Parcubacteria group bacterium Gr01-1014_91]
MRGDKKGWYKVSDLVAGLEIAVPRTSGGSQTSNSDPRSLTSSDVVWDEIISIKPVGREHVYDIEVDGTHNFVGNGIFAHNTYVLRANTMLAVEGVVVPVPTLPVSGGLPSASSALISQIPPEVLTADGLGVDLFKLSTYNLATTTALAARMDAEEVKMTSLESRVTALESGAVSSAGATSSLSLSSSTLASVLSDFGVLIQKGIAQFNTLVFRQLVASKDADGTSSAGNSTIWANNTVAQVSNSLVLPSTKVFVTFNSSVNGSWWVSDKTTGSFRVVLSTPQASDVSFDYFLVQTEGQIATSSPMTSLGGETAKSSASSSSDNTPPVITLLGDNPVYLSVGGTYVEPGVTVTDDVDGTAPVVTFVDGVQMEANSGSIDTSSQTTHIITYSATDAKGNLATANRSVIIGSPAPDSGSQTSPTSSGVGAPTSDVGADTTPADTTAPVVTLVGDAALQINVGDAFTDLGATATDDVDGALTPVVTGSVDTATEGSYTLTYTATDAAGNSANVSRLVTVVASASAPSSSSTSSDTSTATSSPSTTTTP